MKSEYTNNKEYRPRLSIEISKDLQARLRDKVQWGLCRSLVTILIEDVLQLIEDHGNIVIAAILDKRIKARNIIAGLDDAIRKGEKSETI